MAGRRTGGGRLASAAGIESESRQVDTVATGGCDDGGRGAGVRKN